ncbi:MAG TPA: TraB/GumN family protein [Sphingomicrobium sp.]|nr:TraB/GumN family protein [Sphingomicrobium sp.]
MAFLPLLIGAAVAATPLPAAPPANPAPHTGHPALWVVNDSDTIIYLFGTFHALDGNSEWFGQAVRTAFTASDQLMLETLVPKLPAVAMAPSPYGSGPVAQLAPSASYLATTKVVMNAGRTNGLSTDHGADAILRDAADLTGKPVAGLESFEFQLNMFSSLPSNGQSTAPQDAETIRALGAMLGSLKSAWKRGEVETVFTPLLMQMQLQSPQSYKTMFVERNTRWAHWIAERLKAPGTVFVAVGAGHLSGPDSVQRKLSSLGVKSARVN